MRQLSKGDTSMRTSKQSRCKCVFIGAAEIRAVNGQKTGNGCNSHEGRRGKSSSLAPRPPSDAPSGEKRLKCCFLRGACNGPRAPRRRPARSCEVTQLITATSPKMVFTSPKKYATATHSGSHSEPPSNRSHPRTLVSEPRPL